MSAHSERIAGGRVFRLTATSGLITGLSANDVMLAWRNSSSEVVQDLLYLALKWRTVAGFTAGQEMALAAHQVSSFATANYSGGTDLSDPASAPAYVNTSVPLDSTYSYTNPKTKSRLLSGNVRIATTAALTHAGSPVIRAQPFLWDSFAELAAGATTHKGIMDLVYAPDRDVDDVIRFGSDAGFIVRAPIALGAGGTGRLSVEAVWYER